VGGFAGPNSFGFGAFDLAAPQQVSIQVYGQPSFGADGGGGPLRREPEDCPCREIAYSQKRSQSPSTRKNASGWGSEQTFTCSVASANELALGRKVVKRSATLIGYLIP